MYSFSYLEPVCCSMSSSNCCFLTCIQVSQETGQMVWYSHLFQNFPQFIVIHTVKTFGIVNKAEIGVFLELSCFSYDPADVGNLISGSSAFSKTSLNIWKFAVHVLLKPGLENFEHYFTSVWDVVIKIPQITWLCHHPPVRSPQADQTPCNPGSFVSRILSWESSGNLGLLNMSRPFLACRDPAINTALSFPMMWGQEIGFAVYQVHRLKLCSVKSTFMILTFPITGNFKKCFCYKDSKI